MGARQAARPERAPHIESLYAPVDVVAYSALCDDVHADALDAADETAPGRPGSKRRVEFATGRVCADRALEAIGRSAPIGRGSAGEPLWPRGVTGSIAHTGGLCAVVASTAALTVGIDIERVSRVRLPIARRIMSENERRALDELDAAAAQERLAITFAVKEAFYKAHYQREPRWLGFEAIEVAAVAAGSAGQLDVTVAHGNGEVAPAVVGAVHARASIDGDLVAGAVTIAGPR